MYKYVLLFNLASDQSCGKPSTTVISLPRLSTVVYRSATLGTCCSQSSSIVLTTPKSNRKPACFYLHCKIRTFYELLKLVYFPYVSLV